MKSTQFQPPARQSGGNSSNRGRRSPRRKGPSPLKRFLSIVALVSIGFVAVWGGAVLGTHSRDLNFHIPAAMIPSIPSLQAPSAAHEALTPVTGVWTDDSADVPNPQQPVTVERHRENGVSFIVITGGVAGSRRSPTRHDVGDFVKEAGATAGLNGTFFANASLNGTDNLLIGPSLCGDEAQVVIGPFDKRPALRGRPFVMMSSVRTKIVAYDPDNMDDDVSMRYQMPEVSDAFLGGVWLVHNGAAADDDRIETFHVKDANDFRRRAFFALMPDGRPALGATTCSVSSRELAGALAGCGIREAVLLDSGFSTSLVFGDKVLVSGHSTPDLPSRPVPQAVLLFGNPAAATSTFRAAANTLPASQFSGKSPS